MAQRWKGVLNLKSGSKGGKIHEFRVLASLVCSPLGSLMNAGASKQCHIFRGRSSERVRKSGSGTPFPVGEHCSSFVAQTWSSCELVDRGTVTLHGPIACYENILPSLTASGEPLGYKPKGLPAARACLSILQDCLAQVKAAQLRSIDKDATATESGKRNDCSSDEFVPKASPFEPFRDPMNKIPPIILLGFSKGGVILNQMLAEIAQLEGSPNGHDEQRLGRCSTRDKGSTKDGSESEKRSATACGQILPSTVEAFLSSIDEVHYVDVGLNCQGAYQTDPGVLEGLAKAARSIDGGIYVGIHGTPRQWQDPHRIWVVMEKNRCVKLLTDAAEKYGGENYKSMNGFISVENPQICRCTLKLSTVLF